MGDVVPAGHPLGDGDRVPPIDLGRHFFRQAPQQIHGRAAAGLITNAVRFPGNGSAQGRHQHRPVQEKIGGKPGHHGQSRIGEFLQFRPRLRKLAPVSGEQVRPATRRRGGRIDGDGQQLPLVKVTFETGSHHVAFQIRALFRGEPRSQVVNQLPCEAEPGPGMVDDDQIELSRQLIHRHVPKFVQGALFPADAYPGVQLLVPLGGRHQWRQSPAVIPRDAGQLEDPRHRSGVDLHRHVRPGGLAGRLDDLHGGVAEAAVGTVRRQPER